MFWGAILEASYLYVPWVLADAATDPAPDPAAEADPDADASRGRSRDRWVPLGRVQWFRSPGYGSTCWSYVLVKPAVTPLSNVLIDLAPKTPYFSLTKSTRC